jgi:ribosome-associated protein
MVLTLEDRTKSAILAAESKKALDIICLDLRGVSDMADFFIICSGTSTTHVQKVAEEIENKLRKVGEKRYIVEGAREGHWILMDFSDIVVHVFHSETREFYDLERLWGDAPRVKIQH